MCKEKTPILETRHLNKVFTAPDGRPLYANNDISLKFYEGETLGIAGESGCGKSTLVRVLSLLEPPTDGELLLFGENVADWKGERKRKMRRHIQMVFQDSISAVNPRKTVREILREPMRHLLSLKKSEQLARASEMLKAVDLDDSVLDKRPPQLSGGQLQRVCLARALAVEPKLLILDEPTRGIDAGARTDVYNIIKGLSKKGLAVLLISSDMEEIIELSDRAVTIHQGRLNCEFDRADINQENLTKASFGVIGKEKES